METTIKKFIYDTIESDRSKTIISKIFNIFIISLIIINVFAVIISTIEEFSVYSYEFEILEIFSIFIFSVEYVFRVWSCTYNEKFMQSVKGRIRFIFTPLAMIDLLSIMPFYLPMILPFDLRILRLFRLFRLIRIFKLARYSKAFLTIKGVLINKKEEIVLSSVVILFLIIIASSLMYFIENKYQPEAFSSIPAAMWWAVCTLSTVGYGDVYPVTSLGKILASIMAILGIALFALPAGILASGFSEYFKGQKENGKLCPYCGKIIENKKKGEQSG